MHTPRKPGVWLIAAHAPGVDKDVRDLRALFTDGLHPDHRVLPANITDVQNSAGTLLQADIEAALAEIAGWDGPRYVWVGGHGELRGLDADPKHGRGVSFLRTDDRHHHGYVTLDSLWQALSDLATTERPIVAVFDLCHAAPNALLKKHLDDGLVAIAATQRHQRAVAADDRGGWLTQAFIRALTAPAARRDDGLVTVGGVLTELTSASAAEQMGGQRPFVHGIALGDRVLNHCPVATAAPPPPAPDAAAIAAWRRLTARKHKDLVPFFCRGGDRLLDAVYVELTLDAPDFNANPVAAADLADAGVAPPRRASGTPSSSRLGLDDLDAPQPHRHSRPGHLDAETIGAAGDGIDRDLRQRRLSLRELMASRGGVGRWLVLGEPGAGKSTIARHLAETLAAEPGDPVVPIYLPLAKLAQRGTDPFTEAERLLEDSLDGTPGLKPALRARGRGRVWLLLDGLDEVAEDHRIALLKGLREWRDALPDVAIAVFGRPFRDAELTGFTRATVQPLDAAQQRRLLGGWLNETEADLTAATIANHPRLVDLARNPLLLSLMALLTSEGKGLPPNRSKLYHEAIGLLIERPREYGRSGGLSHPAAARRLLGAISVALHHQPGESWAEETVLTAVAATRLDDELRDDLAAYGSPEALLDELARGGGVLGPFEGQGGRWCYLHRSLREFLAAEHLTRGSRLQALFAELGRVENPDHWGVVLGLCCALTPKPLEVLALVRAASAKLALWALPEVELEPEEGLAFFDEVVGDDDPASYGEDLRRLVAGFGDREGARAAVMARVGRSTGVERLAVLHYALSAAGLGVDDAAFFAQAGRPMPARALLVVIEGGAFVMGSPPEEEGRYDNEVQHRVEVTGFELGATPVTVGEYQRFDPTHRCAGGEHHPVTEVRWYGARLYAAWVGCVLPREAEWEYACRAGSGTRYWSGDDEADLAQVGWYNRNAKRQAQPVGGKPANRWGLSDMHGNVWEWCGDWYAAYEPAEARDPAGPPDGVHRVARGGAAWFLAHHARSAQRNGRSPDLRDGHLGFRLARRPPST